MEILKGRRAWSNSFQVLKDYDGQARLIYPAKLSAIIEGERKTFHGNNLKKTYSTDQNKIKYRKIEEGKQA